MAKKDKSKLASLVECWEKATPFMLEALVIRTAAFLSSVVDVPKPVVDALDALGRDDARYLATYIGDVLRFLRELQRIEALARRPGPRGGVGIAWAA